MLNKEVSSTTFLSFCYDSTRDWTLVSQTSGEHSNHHANWVEEMIKYYMHMKLEEVRMV